MKLKQQREDVKWLESWPEEHEASRVAREIAARYKRMILAAEEGLSLQEDRLDKIASKRVKAVLKDADGK